MVQIKWLKSAKQDLKEIYDYIALDSKRYAQLQVERIQQKTELLKNQIRLGKVVDEIQKPDIRELVEGHYRIIYRIVKVDEIHILMVHHGARNLHSRIPKPKK